MTRRELDDRWRELGLPGMADFDSDRIAQVMDNRMINGSGSGQPFGILNTVGVGAVALGVAGAVPSASSSKVSWPRGACSSSHSRHTASNTAMTMGPRNSPSRPKAEMPPSTANRTSR